jgi:2-polyprenyl-3-methyl-5-hydroxy-6-metoxy-1,4-benzoquinol methylase
VTSQEKKIRPSLAIKNMQNLLDEEIKDFFQDKNTGQIKTDILQKTNCPACDGIESKLFLNKMGFKLKSCNDCGLIFLNPRPTEAAQIDFFSQSKALNLYSDLVESTKVERLELIFIPLANKIFNEFGRKGGNLLEVGCGSGLLLEALSMQNTPWKLKGVEPSERAVKICSDKGLDVFNGSLEALKDDQKYDLVVFWAVFDHFYNPFSIIEKCYSLLNPGGSIVIGNINIDGFDSLITGVDNDAFVPPERMNFFGIKSMTMMLERGAFIDIEIKTTGRLDVDIVKNYWESGKHNGRNNFLEKIIFGEDKVRNSFQSFLMDNNLSGHMTVSAKKPI